MARNQDPLARLLVPRETLFGDRWHAFRSVRDQQRAVDWLESEGIRPVPRYGRLTDWLVWTRHEQEDRPCCPEAPQGILWV